MVAPEAESRRKMSSSSQSLVARSKQHSSGGRLFSISRSTQHKNYWHSGSSSTYDDGSFSDSYSGEGSFDSRVLHSYDSGTVESDVGRSFSSRDTNDSSFFSETDDEDERDIRPSMASMTIVARRETQRQFNKGGELGGSCDSGDMYSLEESSDEKESTYSEEDDVTKVTRYSCVEGVGGFRSYDYDEDTLGGATDDEEEVSLRTRSVDDESVESLRTKMLSWVPGSTFVRSSTGGWRRQQHESLAENPSILSSFSQEGGKHHRKAAAYETHENKSRFSRRRPAPTEDEEEQLPEKETNSFAKHYNKHHPADREDDEESSLEESGSYVSRFVSQLHEAEAHKAEIDSCFNHGKSGSNKRERSAKHTKRREKESREDDDTFQSPSTSSILDDLQSSETRTLSSTSCQTSLNVSLKEKIATVGGSKMTLVNKDEMSAVTSPAQEPLEAPGASHPPPGTTIPLQTVISGEETTMQSAPPVVERTDNENAAAGVLPEPEKANTGVTSESMPPRGGRMVKTTKVVYPDGSCTVTEEFDHDDGSKEVRKRTFPSTAESSEDSAVAVDCASLVPVPAVPNGPKKKRSAFSSVKKSVRRHVKLFKDRRTNIRAARGKYSRGDETSPSEMTEQVGGAVREVEEATNPSGNECSDESLGVRQADLVEKATETKRSSTEEEGEGDTDEVNEIGAASSRKILSLATDIETETSQSVHNILENSEEDEVEVLSVFSGQSPRTVSVNNAIGISHSVDNIIDNEEDEVEVMSVFSGQHMLRSPHEPLSSPTTLSIVSEQSEIASNLPSLSSVLSEHNVGSIAPIFSVDTILENDEGADVEVLSTNRPLMLRTASILSKQSEITLSPSSPSVFSKLNAPGPLSPRSIFSKSGSAVSLRSSMSRDESVGVEHPATADENKKPNIVMQNNKKVSLV